MASKVYWADLRADYRENLPQKLTRLMKTAGMGQIDFEDKFAAIKLHFGEPGNLAFLRPNWAKAVADFVKERGGKPFLTDCNTIHPAALTEETVTVAGAVCHYLGQGSFHCVNRLDRGTTGVMVVAKTGYVHRLCMEQLHSGDFRRTYLAVCSGVPSPAAGSIDLPIGREPDSLLRRRVDPAGLAAHTDYETLWQGPDRALLRLTPGTGRTHQLRLHLSAIGHPLLGDWLYGTEDRTLIPRPALHSHRLELTHPVTRRRLTVTAPLPEDMVRLLPEDMNKS